MNPKMNIDCVMVVRRIIMINNSSCIMIHTSTIRVIARWFIAM